MKRLWHASARRWVVLALGALALMAGGASSVSAAPNGLTKARSEFHRALKEAKRFRRSAVDGRVFRDTVRIASFVRNQRAQRLLVELAKLCLHPSQRTSAVEALASLGPAEKDSPDDYAKRLADVALPLSDVIRSTTTMTPDWSIEDVGAANGRMEIALRNAWIGLLKSCKGQARWLERLVTHRQEMVRRGMGWSVLEALPRGVEGLIRQRVKRERDPSVRRLWVHAAALYDIEDLVEEIVPRTDSEDAALRADSVRALQMLAPDHPRVHHALLDGLRSHDPVVQALAARKAGETGRDALTGYLADLLETPHWEVGTQAVRALEHIGSPTALAALVKSLPKLKQDVRARAQAALERMTGQRHSAPQHWRRWWGANQSFDPNEQPGSGLPPEMEGRLGTLPPEGRRFVGLMFLPAHPSEKPEIAATRATLLAETCEGLDEEAALAIWRGGWWSIEGDIVSLALLPQQAPSLPPPRAPRARIRPPPNDLDNRVIPFIDAVPQALETLAKALPIIVGTRGVADASPDTPWRELEEVLANAEVETIVIFATCDLPELPTAATLAMFARLRWAALGRPIRLRLAFAGQDPPPRLVRLVEAFGGTWVIRPPAAAPPAPATEPSPAVEPADAPNDAPGDPTDTAPVSPPAAGG